MSTARTLPLGVFILASEAASLDQGLANARAEWEIQKEQLKRKVKADQDARASV